MSLSSKISSNIDRGTPKSRLARRVLVISTMICFVVIVVSISIERGFRSTIKNKAEDLLGAAIVVPSNPWGDSGVLTEDYDSSLVAEFSDVDGVERVFAVLDGGAVAQKGAVNCGVALHGVDPSAFGDNLAPILTAGSPLLHKDSANVIISSTLATLLGLDVGANLSLVNLDYGMPFRHNFKIGGIYSTSMGEIEKSLVFLPIGYVRYLTGADSTTVAGYEITGEYDIEQMVDLALENMMRVETLEDRVGELFDWFAMLEGNVMLVLLIMIVVAMVNIISSTLIIIIENSQRISLLRAMGMRVRVLQWIFLRRTLLVVCRGALMGVVVGYVIVFLQYKFGFVELDEVSYFVKTLPVDFAVWNVFAVFLLSLSLVVFVVWVITRQLSRMEITKGLKYE